MCVQRCVPRSSGEVLPFFPWNVLTSFGISESLREAEVDQVNIRRFLVTNEEIIGLDVSVQIIARLNMFDSLEALDCNHADSL